ncbi:MAG: hypothetical protein COC23_04795 [Hyphomicrobiales bacterium]|nr:MAG: hypothetical protein COC23_04795 [Hyphomicrobiales bacterium]
MSINSLYGNFRDYVTMKDAEQLRDLIAQVDWFLSERGIRAAPRLAQKHVTNVDASGAEGQLIAGLSAEQDGLCWRGHFPANRFGAAVDENSAFMEIVGSQGHFDSREFGGGFLLLGPGLAVPKHKYSSDLIFIPLNDGSEWTLGNQSAPIKFGGDVFAVESYDTISIETKSNPVIVLVLWREGEFVAEM